MISMNIRQSEWQDARKRKALLPVRIVKIWGNVENETALMNDTPMQAYLGEFAGCILTNSKGGERAAVLLDFGCEIHGIARIVTCMIDGGVNFASMRVRFGESVSEAVSPLGYNNAGNDHAARDQVFVMSALSTRETNESGFRFVYIELIDDAQVQLHAIQAVMIYRDIPRIGAFECSDELINKIYDTSVHTVHMCMQDFLWDGIKRDRLVWMGDMHTEILTILAAFGYQDIVPKSLDFMKCHTPADSWMNGLPSYSLWWIIANRDWYVRTGDREYLLKQREYLKALSVRLTELVDEDGSEQIPPQKFLDWPTSEDPVASHEGMQGLLKTALDAASEMLMEMGEDALSKECNRAAQRMYKHIPKRSGNKGAAAIMSLSGIGDCKRVNEEVFQCGGASGYSCLMGGYILNARAKAGDVMGALDDMREYWGGMLKMGATTFWEDFSVDWMENAAPVDELVPEGMKDIHADFGAFCYKNLRHSLCHGWSSGPVPFVAENILGIKALDAGYKKVSVKGALGDLQYAKGRIPTPYGIIEVSHRALGDGKKETKVEAPEEIEVIIE